MSVFEYIALDEKGRQLKGFIDASGISAARQKLREENIFPVEINQTETKKESALAGALKINLWERVSANQVAVFTRQLSTLLGAGMPLVPSLSILMQQEKNPLLKKSLAQIREQVNEGKSLTEAMAEFPRIFPSFYLNMVRAGEASGTINLVLERLADFSENQQALMNKIRSALAYPIIMFIMGSAVIFLLMTFVVPKITGIFTDMNQTLPLVTIVLIKVSNFLKAFWWIILILLFGGLAAIRYMTTGTDSGRRAWDNIRLKIPVMGQINRKIAIARFCRTLATLLQSGVPLLTAMEIVRNIVNNVIIGDAIHQAARDLEEGKGLSGPLTKSGLFPPLVTEMIAVGEQSGTLETMLNRIAAAYENESQASITVMTSLLEPIMILFMGLVVGFIVVSILLPIFEMNQLVR
ncbi:MAG TPA: type II secretion system inner membrane protein GspF [Smithella sp.]|jgi:general secretion pathway protein F|nr:MAG: Type II secretion system protein F [Deltaproteobacteria bacterium ADurb.Bin022]HOE33181.1 type II secretion system inner membrane protein GspF [Smithella sp.]HPL96190.1 type II secretion system inner membrane protein GspF [Smithellaceae bacterium]HOO35290.1 type II secretion system inner membrane protein GspF [Smithella sp.]HPC07737.1 type II secretion system inner membrane protein GspF [Smithella sp.]